MLGGSGNLAIAGILMAGNGIGPHVESPEHVQSEAGLTDAAHTSSRDSPAQVECQLGSCMPSDGVLLLKDWGWRKLGEAALLRVPSLNDPRS